LANQRSSPSNAARPRLRTRAGPTRTLNGRFEAIDADPHRRATRTDASAAVRGQPCDRPAHGVVESPTCQAYGITGVSSNRVGRRQQSAPFRLLPAGPAAGARHPDPRAPAANPPWPTSPPAHAPSGLRRRDRRAAPADPGSPGGTRPEGPRGTPSQRARGSTHTRSPAHLALQCRPPPCPGRCLLRDARLARIAWPGRSQIRTAQIARMSSHRTRGESRWRTHAEPAIWRPSTHLAGRSRIGVRLGGNPALSSRTVAKWGQLSPSVWGLSGPTLTAGRPGQGDGGRRGPARRPRSARSGRAWPGCASRRSA
jgi:hypothetical protein